jgi:hypothetical protein
MSQGSSATWNLPQFFVLFRYFMFRQRSSVGACLFAKAVRQAVQVLGMSQQSRATHWRCVARRARSA